jgi:glycosyltransferase involved in cell wall biosynthesis
MTKSKIISNIVTKYIVKVFNNCDECWTLNKEVARIFVEEYGYKKQPILINNATEMHPIKDPNISNEIINNKYKITHEKVFIYVGRINKLKNIDLIVKSLKKVNKFDYKMFIIGTGQDEEYLKKLIKTNKLEDKIILLGRITDREKLAEYYARADLQLFPSLYDTNALVQIEAASQHTPTLFVSGAATACNIKDGVNGFIAKNTIADYSRKIEEIMLDEEKLKEVSTNTFKDLYINWDEEVERIYKKYLEIIDRSKEKDI